MCPVCVANAAMTVTGAGSAGGFAAYILNLVWIKIRARKAGIECDVQKFPAK